MDCAISGKVFVRSTAAGGYHAVALRADGSIASWGNDHYGQVSNAPAGTGFTEIAMGEFCSIALRADGSLAGWGLGNDVQISGIPDGTGFAKVALGGSHALALRVDNTGSAFCFGDGTAASCPCGANGNAGAGCANTTGSIGATLSVAGNPYLSHDDFRLVISGVPGNKPGLILQGANQLNGGLGNAMGDGLLCVGGQSVRSHVQYTQGGATTFTNFHFSPISTFSYGIGVPTNYQYWYRDSGNTCSGIGFNFSNAWTTTWLP